MASRNQRIFYSVLSLVLAVAAWVFVVYNYDPYTVVKYKDVPIEFEGESTLAGRGYAVSEASYDYISVTLRQRRINTGKISDEDIRVVADVSTAVIGENSISLDISAPDGTSVEDSQVKSISIVVDDADSKDLPILVEYSDASETGVEPVATDMSSTAARVIAAESVIDKVKKVSARLSYDNVTDKSRSFTTSLAALDSDGEVIPHVQIYPGNVTYKASAGVTKAVRLSVNAVSKDDSSYKRTYSAPDTVIIKGPSSVVDYLTQIKTKEINLNSYYEDAEVEIEYELPEGVVLANSQDEQKIRINVKKIEKDDE